MRHTGLHEVYRIPWSITQPPREAYQPHEVLPTPCEADQRQEAYLPPMRHTGLYEVYRTPWSITQPPREAYQTHELLPTPYEADQRQEAYLPREAYRSV